MPEPDVLVVKKGTKILSKTSVRIPSPLSDIVNVGLSLEKNFIKMGAFSSATVKSDGSIGLILDVGGLVELQKQMEKKGIL